MPQHFPRRSNFLVRFALGSAAPVGLAMAAAVAGVAHSRYLTGGGQSIAQPAPFPHDVHAGRLRLDCRYCHATVERSSFAGLPGSDVCMECHRRVWTGLPGLEPVQASYATRIPLSWRRVHDLPDFAHFDHAIHVAKGVGCVSCHGRVDQMALTRQTETLRMDWCLDCHRDPVPQTRPREFVFDLDWQPPEDDESLRKLCAELQVDPPAGTVAELRRALAERYGIRKRTSCSICHQ